MCRPAHVVLPSKEKVPPRANVLFVGIPDSFGDVDDRRASATRSNGLNDPLLKKISRLTHRLRSCRRNELTHPASLAHLAFVVTVLTFVDSFLWPTMAWSEKPRNSP